MRTLTGTMVFGSMCVREGKQAAVTAALTLMLDGLLYCFAIQITAARSEDRLVALLGLSLHALLAIVYFVEHTRRRNLVPTVVAAVNEDE